VRKTSSHFGNLFGSVFYFFCMKKFSLADQWHKYRRKKTVVGIAFDLLFTALLISMIFPVSRRAVSSTIIRYSLFQPRESEEVTFVSKEQMDWEVEDLEGNRIKMDQFFGRPVFINFWATWCPPCIAEMPSIQRLYDIYGDKVTFVLASHEEAKELSAFLKKKEYTLPVYVIDEEVPEVFYSRSIPATFLISAQGKIVMKKQGAAKWDGKRVKQLLDRMME